MNFVGKYSFNHPSPHLFDFTGNLFNELNTYTNQTTSICTLYTLMHSYCSAHTICVPCKHTSCISIVSWTF